MYLTTRRRSDVGDAVRGPGPSCRKYASRMRGTNRSAISASTPVVGPCLATISALRGSATSRPTPPRCSKDSRPDLPAALCLRVEAAHRSETACRRWCVGWRTTGTQHGFPRVLGRPLSACKPFRGTWVDRSQAVQPFYGRPSGNAPWFCTQLSRACSLRDCKASVTTGSRRRRALKVSSRCKPSMPSRRTADDRSREVRPDLRSTVAKQPAIRRPWSWYCWCSALHIDVFDTEPFARHPPELFGPVVACGGTPRCRRCLEVVAAPSAMGTAPPIRSSRTLPGAERGPTCSRPRRISTPAATSARGRILLAALASAGSRSVSIAAAVVAPAGRRTRPRPTPWPGSQLRGELASWPLGNRWGFR